MFLTNCTSIVGRYIYQPAKLTIAMQVVYPQIMSKIRFELAPKPTPADKLATGKTGFVPVATKVGN